MELTLEHYERIKSCLPRQRGNVRVGNLTLLNALLHILEPGCKWRSLPTVFGPWHTVYMRLYRWSKAGVIERVFIRLQEEQILAIKLEVPCLDSMSVKVRPDGAGARKKTAPKPSASRAGAGTPRFIWWPRLRVAP